jgi:exodeoxyribonuclease-3
MRIVTWNCAMAFRDRKTDALESLAPDLAVIQECSSQDAEAYAVGTGQTWLWGHPYEPEVPIAGRVKGLAVFARRGIELTLKPEHDQTLRVMLPIEVGGDKTFNLLAVWTQIDSRGRDFTYSGGLCHAVERYAEFLTGTDTVVVGNFNSNVALDRRRRLGHAELDRRLADLGLTSIYHEVFQEKQGEETRPTHYFYRHQHRPFHIDYCYVPKRGCQEPRCRSEALRSGEP